MRVSVISFECPDLNIVVGGAQSVFCAMAGSRTVGRDELCSRYEWGGLLTPPPGTLPYSRPVRARQNSKKTWTQHTTTATHANFLCCALQVLLGQYTEMLDCNHTPIEWCAHWPVGWVRVLHGWLHHLLLSSLWHHDSSSSVLDRSTPVLGLVHIIGTVQHTFMQSTVLSEKQHTHAQSPAKGSSTVSYGVQLCALYQCKTRNVATNTVIVENIVLWGIPFDVEKGVFAAHMLMDSALHYA